MTDRLNSENQSLRLRLKNRLDRIAMRVYYGSGISIEKKYFLCSYCLEMVFLGVVSYEYYKHFVSYVAPEKFNYLFGEEGEDLEKWRKKRIEESYKSVRKEHRL